MKRILSILVAAVMLVSCFTVVTSAKTADIVHQSVEGTAVIDGTKDDAYASGLILPMAQKGNNNGGGAMLDAPIAYAYYLNDAEYVYVLVEVTDSTLDNTSANNYEQDSVELFYMADNSKVQLRFCYDGTVSADTGNLPAEGDYAIVLTDAGYNVEFKMPITDVLNNQIETTVQVNYCADGVRSHTTYIEGNGNADDAYQRTNRQTEWDVWWTLALAGDHADTRVDPVPEPMELKPNNYQDVLNNSIYVQLYTQCRVDWSGWASIGTGTAVPWAQTLDYTWDSIAMLMNYDETTTADYTVDPVFSMQIGDNGWLKLPEGAVAGDLGDEADYVINYGDITIKAEGYNDVVVPGGVIDTTWQIKEEGGWQSGNNSSVDLVNPIKTQLGLDTAGLCEYLKVLTSVSTSVTYVSYNLVDQAVMDAYLVQLDAEDEALIVELQEYADKVTEAKAAADAANGDVAALEAAASDAQKAVNRALKEAEGYTKATEWANGLQATVDEINAMVEAAKAPAETPAEDETPAETPAEDEKPADEKPADTASEGGATGIIIAVVAVVVIAVVAVVAFLAKKKK